ncbi:threonine-phosphate decarboxylase CobD [Acaryochloris thomasi]|uniref:threonine-phosphate decarboxylase CobD n=1 Tax=Acaryochloris thomasi TaxID=2929456 RepID=UPI000DA6495A|nr:threonine-phosphate decarboxylase CobD [Acaryochloris thomasi]
MKRPLHGGNLSWAAHLAGCEPGEVLDFSASINPLGPPASALAAIKCHLGDLSAYPDPASTALRQAISEFHQVSADWILPGNGSAELLTWACRDLAQLRATHVLVPAFSDYHRALTAFSAVVQVHALNVEPGLPTFQDWQPLLSGPNAGLLFNNPHNPTGGLLGREYLLACLDQFELVVVDEAFMDFLPVSDQQSLLDEVINHQNLVILRSQTKFYSLPGLRLGYAVAHPDRLARWQRWRDPWSVNALATAAGTAVLRDQAFQQRTWDWLPPARAQLFTGLQQLGLQPLPGVANYLLVAAPCSVTALQQLLMQEARILIRDCISFPELGDRYFRVAVRTLAENQQLLQALAAVLPRLPRLSGDGRT